MEKEDLDKLVASYKRSIALRNEDIRTMADLLSSFLELFSDKDIPQDLSWALDSLSSRSVDLIIDLCSRSSSVIEDVIDKYDLDLED